MLLRVHNLVMSFGGLRAVDDVSLDVGEGEVVGVIGPNGAGKSTLFGCIAGDLRPSEGTIEYVGRPITHLPPEERARLGIARTFQIPQTFSNMSVLENVMVGAFLKYKRPAQAREAALRILELTELYDRRDLSARGLGTPGRKRLEIARALALEPRLLLLDEAMAGLTPTETQAAIQLIRQIQRETGVALIIVEHVMEVIITLTERVIVLDQGRAIARGSPGEVMRDPRVTAAYLGKRAVYAR